uniref:Uncharacterized protein n=1 Tax=Daphnia galeata TaxID=27404 RepID=A0A8J2RH70_9CRUS|nr:unnamed protein product [Daphnia galeata]
MAKYFPNFSSSLTTSNNIKQEADDSISSRNFDLIHCCHCGILLDPKNLTVNVNTRRITVLCNQCRKMNALGKIRHNAHQNVKSASNFQLQCP